MLLHLFSFTFFEKHVLWYIQQWMLLKGALTWNKFTHFVRIFYTFRLRNIIPFVKKYFYICWEISFSDGACAIEKQWPPLTWNKFTSSPPPLGNLSNLTWNSIGECHNPWQIFCEKYLTEMRWKILLHFSRNIVAVVEKYFSSSVSS